MCPICLGLPGMTVAITIGTALGIMPAPVNQLHDKICPPPSRKVAISPQARRSTTTWDEFGTDDVKLGDRPERVKTRLGEPDRLTILHGIGIPLWIYDKLGIQVGFRAADGTVDGVIYIRAANGYPGKTLEGIGLGDSEGAVLRTYGRNPVTVGNRTLRFDIRAGQVQQIIVTEGL